MQNTQPIFVSQSFTGYMEQKVSNTCLVKKEDLFPSRFTKLTTGLISFGLVGLLGLVETVFRYALYILLSSLCSALPKQAFSGVQNSILIPLKNSAEVTAESTKESFYKMVTNYFVRT